MTLQDRLNKMRDLGTSAILCTAEDGEAWECSWITGGKRYTEFAANPEQAVTKVILKAGGIG